MDSNLITLPKDFTRVRFALLVILLIFPTKSSLAQIDTGRTKTDTLPKNYFELHMVDRNGQVLPEVEMKEVLIIGRTANLKKFPYEKYDRMVYNLKKVYPYAIIVRERLAQVNGELLKIPDDRDRKKYLRQVEKDVFKEYEDDIRDMTITQGKLLIKLIDRETYNTSYDLIREYRVSFSAAFWQSIARIFGTNLKEEYDPTGKDTIMEIILQEIEAGRL